MWALTINGRICEGKRNQGETQEVGDPGGASRKRATTKVVARFICLFVLALTTQANTVAGEKTRPHDDAQGLSTTQRAQKTTRRAQKTTRRAQTTMQRTQ